MRPFCRPPPVAVDTRIAVLPSIVRGIRHSRVYRRTGGPAVSAPGVVGVPKGVVAVPVEVPDGIFVNL